MHAITATPGARRLLGISIVARLPLTMLSIGFLLHARQLTGSYAAAGAVDAAYAIALALGGPLLGRVVDRRGQTALLLASSAMAAGLLGVVATLPVGAPLPLLLVLAGGIGASAPPLGACLRALVPGLMPDPAQARAFYAIDATALELTWITGPALAVTVGSAWTTGAALAAAGTMLLAGTLAFAAEPASRNWRPAPAGQQTRKSPGRSAGLRTLFAVMAAVGVVYSAVQIGIAAAVAALGTAAAAGPLLAIWGVGSMLGGLVATRLGGGARGAAGLALLLLALTVGHATLGAVATSTLGMAAVLLLAGTTIAPTEASVYAMVEQVAPAGTLTEAFAWLATATALGAALGAATGGSLVASLGPISAFGLAGGAGVLAVLAATLRQTTLPAARAPHAGSPAPAASPG